jgi:hypothetical protein
VLAGPEVFPVAAVGRGEEVVLDDDGDEEPLDGGEGLLALVRMGGEGRLTKMTLRRMMER